MAVIASDAGIAGMQQNYPPRSAVISWIFFDWAAQPYFTLITTFVFAPYFATHVASDAASGQALWGGGGGEGGCARRAKAVDRGIRRAAGDRLRPAVVRQARRHQRDSGAAV